MKNLKKYLVYTDDGTNAYRIAVPAESEDKAREFVDGNGEIIAVKDITEEYPIDAAKVRSALQLANFGQTEIDLITRTLADTGITQDYYAGR